MDEEPQQIQITAGYSERGQSFVAVTFPMSVMKIQDDGSLRMEITGQSAAYIGTCLVAASRDGKADAALFLHIAEAALAGGASQEDAVRIAAKTVREVKERRNALP